MSVPFARKAFTFHNPDGSAVDVLGWGDQFGAVFETLDGFTVVQEPTSGFFQFARLSADARNLEPTGVNVGAADPATVGVTPSLRLPRGVTKARAQARREGAGRRRWEVRREQRRAQVRSAAAVGAESAPPPAGTTGDYVGLCLLVQFPDVAGTITSAQVTDFCNKPGYAGFGNNGSVRDYFRSVSDGKLTYTNQVTAYYTTKHPRAYYTDRNIPQGTRAQELIKEALTTLKAGGYDFSALTTDDGGFVYALNVFYAGEIVNNWSEGLWPHSWTLGTPFVAAPSITLGDYQITNIGSELTLRTFCHENGHMICDFPDLYDYGYESTGVGHYCLMCFGGVDKNPTQVCAYLKHSAGWTSKLTPLSPESTATVAAGKNDFLIYRKNANEYFILENRMKSGRDASLPDAGLAIWHVDELGYNGFEQMTPTEHYECSLEQADGRFDLERNAGAGDNDDLHGAPLARAFGRATVPNSTWWDGTSSGLEIEQISAPGPTMTLSTDGLLRTWKPIGHAKGVVGMTASSGKLFAATDSNKLYWRDPVGADIPWTQIGDARGVTALAAVNGKLFAVTSANKLYSRPTVGTDVPWKHIGHADGVVAMAGLDGKLFAVTRSNRLYTRDPVETDVAWKHIGHAKGVVAMTAINGKLFAATADNKLYWRDPLAVEIPWTRIGTADGVVAMAAVAGKLFAATGDDKLYWRDPVA